MTLALCLTVALFALTGPDASAAATARDKVVGYLVSYTLQAGDTIYTLCEKKGLDFGENYITIGKINNITNYNYMIPGKVLWLPSKTAVTGTPYYSLLSHTLAQGETPASLCQSYGIDYNSNYNLLAALNTNMTTLMAGQQFILPLYNVPPTDQNRPQVTPTATPGAVTVTATPAPTTATGVPGDTVSYYLAQHVLQSGETVSGICAALGMDYNQVIDTIQSLNDIANFNYMLPGKTLLIPMKSVPTSGSYYKVMVHTMVSGDTVYSLCTKYGLDYYTYESMLQKLNNRTNMTTFYVGEIIYLPLYVAAPTSPVSPPPSSGTVVQPTAIPTNGTVVQPTATPTVGTRPTATPTVGTQPTASAGVTVQPTATSAPVDVPQEDTLEYLIIPHVLKSGETVSGICADLKVDFMTNYDRIMELSNITSYNYLLPGKEILIPSTTYPASGPYYKVMKHILVAGDTVYNLCLKYGLDYNSNVAFLQRLNGRDNMTTFYVGQAIYLPLYVAG